MAAKVVTVAFEGVEARRVDVEVQLTGGQQVMVIVGLGDKAVAESKERVRGAFAGLGLALPGKRIVANLAPADMPKEGNFLTHSPATVADFSTYFQCVNELSNADRLSSVSGTVWRKPR